MVNYVNVPGIRIRSNQSIGNVGKVSSIDVEQYIANQLKDTFLAGDVPLIVELTDVTMRTLAIIYAKPSTQIRFQIVVDQLIGAILNCIV